jgi:hypothetical protein
VCIIDQADRQGQFQFASLCLMAGAALKTSSQDMQLCLRKSPFKTCEIKHHILVKIRPSSADTSR